MDEATSAIESNLEVTTIQQPANTCVCALNVSLAALLVLSGYVSC